MRPLRIYLKNFMNHRESEVDCSDINSLLIVGKSHTNERYSNGVGKTTLFNAIEYAIFNQSHSTTLDKIVRDGSKKATVEFDFELGSDKYRIYRHRTQTGTADSRLYKWDGKAWESISERTPSATDTKILELIKISHKSFTYSVLFRQADLTGLTTVDDGKKRKEILKEPMNLTQYTKLEEIAVKKLRPVKREIEQNEASIKMLGDPAADILVAKNNLITIADDIDAKKSEIAKSQASIDACRAAIDKLKSSLNKEDSEVHTKISEQEEKINKLSTQISQAEKKVTALEISITKSETDLSKLEADRSSNQLKLDKLLEEDVKPLDEVKKRLTKVSEDDLKFTGTISEIKAEIRILTKTIPNEDVCTSCMQSITPEYRKKFEEEISAKLDDKKKALATYEDNHGKCKRLKVKLEEEVSKLTKRNSDIEILTNKLNSISKSTSSLNDSLSVQKTDLEVTRENLSKLEEDMASAVKYFSILKDRASKSNVAGINNEIFSLQAEIVIYEKGLEALQGSLNDLSRRQGALHERVRSRTEDLEKVRNINAELLLLKQKLSIHQMVVDAFSHKGIPTFIIQTILDDLQFEVSAALRELRPEFEVQIDADLNFTYKRNGQPRDYEQLSHGQHIYIALAFKRGMSRVIQKRLGIDIRFMLLDEIDSALDEAGTEACAEAIKKWQKEFTVFVITHNKDLKDKFTHAILVEEGADGSTARLVNQW